MYTLKYIFLNVKIYPFKLPQFVIGSVRFAAQLIRIHNRSFRSYRPHIGNQQEGKVLETEHLWGRRDSGCSVWGGCMQPKEDVPLSHCRPWSLEAQ